MKNGILGEKIEFANKPDIKSNFNFDIIYVNDIDITLPEGGGTMLVEDSFGLVVNTGTEPIQKEDLKNATITISSDCKNASINVGFNLCQFSPIESEQAWGSIIDSNKFLIDFLKEEEELVNMTPIQTFYSDITRKNFIGVASFNISVKIRNRVCYLQTSIKYINGSHNYTLKSGDRVNSFPKNYKKLYVGGSGEGNYTKIQDAIDNASEGYTVFAYNGTYYENLVIQKQIMVIGENNTNTIIDGSRKNHTISIKSEKVTIRGFTITNSSNDTTDRWYSSGIHITGSNNIIEDNIISNNILGIFGKQVTNLTIINNIFVNDGVIFYPYDRSYKIRPPLVKEHFIHTIENNTVNGKPLLYYLDQDNIEIPSSSIGQLIAVNCTNIKLRNATLSNTDFMIMFVFCSNCLIENSTIINNDGALSFLGSNNNVIKFNTISNNFHGILLDYYSKKNKIIYNNISSNQYCGVICEYFSNKNIIQNNNLIDNKNANGYFIKTLKNSWKNNYWSDWIGLQIKIFKFLPKRVIGSLSENIYLPLLVNFDWSPAQEPYNI
jgi:parallel beta-helix repeat protein